MKRAAQTIYLTLTAAMLVGTIAAFAFIVSLDASNSFTVRETHTAYARELPAYDDTAFLAAYTEDGIYIAEAR